VKSVLELVARLASHDCLKACLFEATRTASKTEGQSIFNILANLKETARMFKHTLEHAKLLVRIDHTQDPEVSHMQREEGLTELILHTFEHLQKLRPSIGVSFSNTSNLVSDELLSLSSE